MFGIMPDKTKQNFLEVALNLFPWISFDYLVRLFSYLGKSRFLVSKFKTESLARVREQRAIHVEAVASEVRKKIETTGRGGEGEMCGEEGSREMGVNEVSKLTKMH